MTARRISAWLWLGLAVAACGGTEEPAPLTRNQLLDPESCKDCHPKHYQEWSSSMHAYASTDPVFLAMNKRGQEEANLGQFCVQCHAPMAVREHAITDFGDLSSVPKHLQGVTCYFCHNATSAGEPHNNANIQLANDTVMRGPLNNVVKPWAHDVGYSPHHDPTKMESSVMCGTCHDIMTPSGFHLERTFFEYQKSNISKPPGFLSCQDCHMVPDRNEEPTAVYPGVSSRTNHSHLWPAVDVALTEWPNRDAMRIAVERCELQQRSLTDLKVEAGQSVPGEPFSFTVFLETAAAHSMPSGAASDRRMWVDLIAYDSAGTEVLKSGQIAAGEVEEKPADDPAHDPNFCVFRDRIFNAEGKEVHMFWEATQRIPAEPKVLPPQVDATVRHYAECSFRTPRGLREAPAKISVRVRMRPMGVDVLQDLVSSGHLDPKYVAEMPTFTVADREFELDPATRAYTLKMDLAQDDCDLHAQMLACARDPQSPNCQP